MILLRFPEIFPESGSDYFDSIRYLHVMLLSMIFDFDTRVTKEGRSYLYRNYQCLIREIIHDDVMFKNSILSGSELTESKSRLSRFYHNLFISMILSRSHIW